MKNLFPPAITGQEGVCDHDRASRSLRALLRPHLRPPGPLQSRDPTDALSALAETARRSGQSLQRKPRLLRSFLDHSSLFLRLKQDIT